MENKCCLHFEDTIESRRYPRVTLKVLYPFGIPNKRDYYLKRPKRMKNTLFFCLLSGVMGGLFALLAACMIFPTWSGEVPAQGPVTPPSTAAAPVAPAVTAQNTLQTSQTSVGEITPDRLQGLLPEEQAAIMVYERQNKCVVNIETVFSRLQNFMFREEAEGRGSGIVLSNQGIILTNFHVVEKANTITVTLYNGESYPAKKIGEDPNTDIALLKISGAPQKSLVPVTFGDSGPLMVGQTVYAIGNPFGNERTMTRGIVSNLNRTIESPQQFRQIKGVIQIDAAINPGNSGGPLFDSRGRMIGMNTAIMSRVGENSGVGFAVPVNTIKRIAAILLESGKVVRGDVGISQVTETEHGLLPVLIDDNGAADRAGLRGRKVVVVVSNQSGMQLQTVRALSPKEGMDLIIGVNGQPTRSGEAFITAIEEHRPGETVQLNIIRKGQKMSLPVVLD